MPFLVLKSDITHMLKLNAAEAAFLCHLHCKRRFGLNLVVRKGLPKSTVQLDPRR